MCSVCQSPTETGFKLTTWCQLAHKIPENVTFGSLALASANCRMHQATMEHVLWGSKRIAHFNLSSSPSECNQETGWEMWSQGITVQACGIHAMSPALGIQVTSPALGTRDWEILVALGFAGMNTHEMVISRVSTLFKEEKHKREVKEVREPKTQRLPSLAVQQGSVLEKGVARKTATVYRSWYGVQVKRVT